MNEDTRETCGREECRTERHKRYREEGFFIADKLWEADPTLAYRRWERDRKQELPKDLPECDRLKSEGILIELGHHVENAPHKINANDPRLQKAEREDLLARQKAHFHDAAFESLTWFAARENTGDTPLVWPIVSKLFYDLETAFDPSFHDTGVGQMTGTSQADINNKVDALLAARQAKLALALWELDSALATRYADVLRGIKMPLGLSEVEKRTAFLQEIERREGKGASVPAQDAARKGEPEAKKRAYNPFNNHEQRRFAELWVATRDEQGRSPYARNFLAENAEELKKIRVVTVKDVERIRDAVSKRGLLPRWNRPRKRRKSGGKYRQ